MRIGIGAQLGIVGGPATYAAELARALARLGGHEYVVFTDRPETFGDVGVETVLVPTSGGEGPYQAKAIGELANNATAAAIANAVADAVGCQLFELPITAERIYTALHQIDP